jgi:hypothetical protein
VRNPRGDNGAGETPPSVSKVVVGGGVAGGALAGCASDGGNAGSVGGAGGSRGGEAGSTPGGIGGGATDGCDAGSVGEDGVGSLDGGVAGQVGGERSNLPSGSEARNSSTSFRRFLVLLAGGGTISGAERVAVGHCSAGTRVHQPEWQRREWLIGLEI